MQRNTQLLERLAIFTIIALGFALRLHGLGRESLWYDELLQLDIAQDSLTSILPQLPRHSAVPLDYFISHFWILGGRSETWVRLPAALLGALTLPWLYLLGRRLLDGQSSLVFTAMLAISPIHIRYSQEVRPYALLILGLVLAGYSFWQLRQTGRRRYAISLQLGVLFLALAHFFAIVIFIPWLMFAGLDVLTGRPRRRPLQAGLALLVTGAVALGLILGLGWGRTLWNVTYWGFGQAVVNPERFTVEADEKPNLGAGPQADFSWSFIKEEVLTPFGAGSSATFLRLFNGLALLGGLYLLIQKRYKTVLWLGLWLVLPVAVIVAFLIQRGAFYEPRYIMTALPAYLALAAVGLLALPRWLRCAEPGWIAPGALALLGGLVIWGCLGTVWRDYNTVNKEDWRLVSRVIAQNIQPGQTVIAVNAEPALNWYYPPAQADLDTFDRLEAVKTAVLSSERSWVVMSIYTGYIPDGRRVEQWLHELGAVRLALDPLIDVYYVGPTVSPPQLLAEVRTMALPVNHTLYAELARQNRRAPAIARSYFQAAITHAPTEALRVEYTTEMETLPKQ